MTPSLLDGSKSQNSIRNCDVCFFVLVFAVVSPTFASVRSVDLGGFHPKTPFLFLYIVHTPQFTDHN